MSASTDRIPQGQMSTWHETGPFATEMLYVAQQSGTKNLSLHNESITEIQKVLQECLDEGKRFRAHGSLWSLNDVAICRNRNHANFKMKLKLDIDSSHIDSQSSLDTSQLVFTQCGATINQITNYLERQGRSLKVSGGSNGQTIAGAISTGVHGAAFDHQCISDYVRGIQIIRGPGVNDRIYLERASDPILNDTFASDINSQLIRDDDLFNAAIVGLGSFGFIGAVILEVSEIFTLRRYVKSIEYPEAMRLLMDLDFDNPNFQIEGEEGNRPYHFKVFINQYTKKSITEVMYKKAFAPAPKPDFKLGSELHPDLFRVMNWAIEKSDGKLVKLISSLLQGSVMPNPKKETEPIDGTLGDMFDSIDFQQPGFSWAFGVDQAKLSEAMDVFLEVFETHKVPGLSAIKLVKQTAATIGFARFPVTAIIHLDGIQWTASGRLWPQEQIETELVKAFVRKGVEFTLHWGKNGDWNYPGLVDYMYGATDDEWVKQRSRLLNLEQSELFANDFIKRIGLGGFDRSVSQI